MSFFKSGLSDKSIELDASRLRVLLSSRSMPPGAVAEIQNVIQRVPAGSGDVQVYPKTAAGLTQALSDASGSTNIIWLPPCTLAGNFTIPANNSIYAWGSRSQIQGTVTMGAATAMGRISVVIDDSSASALVGVVGPSSGVAILNNCGIAVTNSGAGDAYGLQGGAGEMLLWNCSFEGTASSGNGYGIYEGDGQIYMEGGRLMGSTLPASKGVGAPAVYSPGSEISTGSITVNSGAGHTISGLTPGSLYCVEAYDCYLRWPAASTRSTNQIQLNNGSGWLGRFGAEELDTGCVVDGATAFFTDIPNWCEYLEYYDSYKPRVYFQATTTEIYVRVWDNYWSDNVGSLSWRLREASLSAGAVDATILVNAVRMDTPSGIPTQASHSAWDAQDYPERHANDLDTGLNAIHHTLGTGAFQAAPGDHVHSALDLTSRWEPLTNGDGTNPEHVFLDGDVIMVEIET